MMAKRLLVFFLVLLVCFGLSIPSGAFSDPLPPVQEATTVAATPERLGLPELTAGAERILRGTVLSTACFMEPETQNIFTLSLIHI